MKTIAFLVKKPAQFDVPLFQHIAAAPAAGWRFVVIYLENPAEVLHDEEINANSDWGISLTAGYEWHCPPSPASIKAIKELYDHLQPAVIFTNGYQFNYAPFIQVARGRQIPMGLRIDSILGGKSAFSLMVRKWLMRWRYRYFGGFLTTGMLGYKYLDFIGIPASQQFWFPYCTHNQFFAAGLARQQRQQEIRDAHGINIGKPVVLGVCKFIERENPIDLLDAFIALNDTGLQLVMVGDGIQAALLKQRAGQHAHLHIFFPGYVKYTDLPLWYALATVFVHPALDEPWGVSLQEAMAAGCKLVASSGVGSAYDFIKEGENGFIYPVGKPNELAVCIKNSLALPEASNRRVTANILTKWNYSNVWQHLQEAAAAIG